MVKFADDTTAGLIAHEHAYFLEVWSSENKLQLNVSKTKMIVDFHRNHYHQWWDYEAGYFKFLGTKYGITSPGTTMWISSGRPIKCSLCQLKVWPYKGQFSPVLTGSDQEYTNILNLHLVQQHYPDIIAQPYGVRS